MKLREGPLTALAQDRADGLGDHPVPGGQGDGGRRAVAHDPGQAERAQQGGAQQGQLRELRGEGDGGHQAGQD